MYHQKTIKNLNFVADVLFEIVKTDEQIMNPKMETD